MAKNYEQLFKKNLPTPNTFYQYDATQSNFAHARMRIGCSELNAHLLTHLPLMPHMCVGDGSELIQIMACRLVGAQPLSEPMLEYLLIGPLGTTFSEIRIKIQNFSFIKMPLKISSAKWWSFRSGGDELRNLVIGRPACASDGIYEDAYLNLFICPRYLGQRVEMITAVCPITSWTIGCLLYGFNNVDLKYIELFEHVYKYISET